MTVVDFSVVFLFIWKRGLSHEFHENNYANFSNEINEIIYFANDFIEISRVKI